MVLVVCLWLIPVACVLVGYAFVFGLLRRVNDWYYVFKLGKLENPLPPGEMGLPLLGNMPSFFRAFNSDPESFINHLISRYGKRDMYRTHLFGYPSIIVCNPETCRRILIDDEQVKLGYPPSTMAILGKKPFSDTTVVEHRRIRRLVSSPITGYEALSTYIDSIESFAVKMLQDLSAMNKPCEFLSELRMFSFEVVTTIFMSSDIHPRIDISLLEKLFTDLSRGMSTLAINLPGFPFYKALKARKKLIKLLQGMVDHKRKNKNITESERKKDIMDLFMEVRDEEGRQMEDEDIIDLIMVLFLAGHESSAHGVMWTIIYLTQHPHLFQRAKKEQEEIMEARPSTQKGLILKEIKQMGYLSKVIDEMLRRTTIAFANFRQTKVDINVNGYTIPKGWKVIVWNRDIHMNPENYQNPKEFDPSRWENNAARGSFLPFGYGSRFCPGSDLVKLEISIILHHFLLYYRMERLNPKCPITYIPFPCPSDNCFARIIKTT